MKQYNKDVREIQIQMNVPGRYDMIAHQKGLKKPLPGVEGTIPPHYVELGDGVIHDAIDITNKVLLDSLLEERGTSDEDRVYAQIMCGANK